MKIYSGSRSLRIERWDLEINNASSYDWVEMFESDLRLVDDFWDGLVMWLTDIDSVSDFDLGFCFPNLNNGKIGVGIPFFLFFLSGN